MSSLRKTAPLKMLWNNYGTGTLFFLPFLVLFIIFLVIPVGTAVVLSFTDYDMMSTPVWVGVDNYRQLFIHDEEFAIAFKNTLLFALVIGPFAFIFSFIMAWLINQLKCRDAFTLAFYVPSIASGGAMATIWGLIFSNDRYGIINSFLYKLGIISKPIMFSADEKWIMPIIMLLYVWMSLGAGFLSFLAGLQGVSGELYEAGMVDGITNRFQELRYITLPQMKPQLLFASITGITGVFGVFDISVQFAGLPSPNYAGHTLAIHLYDHAFIRFEMGYACACAVVLFAMISIVGKVCNKLFASNI